MLTIVFCYSSRITLHKNIIKYIDDQSSISNTEK